jgi:thymidine kinase
MAGGITLIVGPMFAGKTTELMRRIKREVFAKKQCCIIKYARDTRYNAVNMATHDELVLTATFAISKLEELGNKWMKYDVIAIDEGQFFGDLFAFATMAADLHGKQVIISALDGDFQRKPFGAVCELIPHCEEVHKLHAVCMNCHEKDACFTMRVVAGDQVELIGSEDMYRAVCRTCYVKHEPPTPRRVQAYAAMVKNVKKLVHGDAPEVDETPASKKHRSESPDDNKKEAATATSPIVA